MGAIWTVLLALAVGCSTSSVVQRKADTTLTRFSKAGHEAFAEGDVDGAIEEYRSALLRAWAIDDPYESGTNAYNLAACMTSASEVDQAKEWLLDARVELCRAGASAGNVWVLEAKVAKDECRFEDANRYLCRAERTDPPCEQADGGCLCGPRDPCQQSCVTKIPCVGEKIAQKQASKDCRGEFQAQIHLVRAALAAEQYDIETARCQFECACQLATDICSHNLQAELQHVAALIHLASGQFLQAAWHFDNEAKHLRLAGNYREIPTALNHAASAFEEAARSDLGASRMGRVARIWLGRGDARQAWHYLQLASQMAQSTPCPSATIRLALVAREIERVLAEENESTDQMIESENASPLPQSQFQPIDGPF
jgi:tetratricopeptide (TPR) repeat protein